MDPIIETRDGTGGQRIALTRPAETVLSLTIDGLAIPAGETFPSRKTAGYGLKGADLTLIGYVFTRRAKNEPFFSPPKAFTSGSRENGGRLCSQESARAIRRPPSCQAALAG